MEDNNETKQPEAPTPAETDSQPETKTSMDSGMEFEKVKRYVDASIAKMLDDIIKKDKEKEAKKVDENEEKKGLEKW